MRWDPDIYLKRGGVLKFGLYWIDGNVVERHKVFAGKYTWVTDKNLDEYVGKYTLKKKKQNSRKCIALLTYV